MKKDLEKKNKIKELIFKIIHSITYVLSALFIIVCIAVGVQSCNSKKNKTSDKRLLNNRLADVTIPVDDFDYYYESIYSGSMTYDTDGLYNIASRLGYGDSYQSYQSDVELNQYFNGGIYIKDENQNLSPLTRVRVILSTYSFGTQGWKYVLNYVHYWTTDSMFNYFAINDFSVAEGCSVTFQNQGDLIFSDSLIDENSIFYKGVLAPFYKTNSNGITDFAFNNRINYNGYYNASLNSPYIPFSTLSNNIDLPWFVSGGYLYNRIHLQFTDAQGSSFLDDSNNVFVLNASSNTFMTYLYMEYVNTYTGLTTLVNNRDFGVRNNGSSTSRFNLNSSSWVSTNFRSLKFLGDLDNEDLNLISKFNSNTSNINTGVYYSDIGLGNVFALLSSAFSGLIGLFTIQLIPGITIGVLLFMPLIVGIIIVIVKLVKK